MKSHLLSLLLIVMISTITVVVHAQEQATVSSDGIVQVRGVHTDSLEDDLQSAEDNTRELDSHLSHFKVALQDFKDDLEITADIESKLKTSHAVVRTVQSILAAGKIIPHPALRIGMGILDKSLKVVEPNLRKAKIVSIKVDKKVEHLRTKIDELDQKLADFQKNVHKLLTQERRFRITVEHVNECVMSLPSNEKGDVEPRMDQVSQEISVWVRGADERQKDALDAIRGGQELRNYIVDKLRDLIDVRNDIKKFADVLDPIYIALKPLRDILNQNIDIGMTTFTIQEALEFGGWVTDIAFDFLQDNLSELFDVNFDINLPDIPGLDKLDRMENFLDNFEGRINDIEYTISVELLDVSLGELDILHFSLNNVCRPDETVLDKVPDGKERIPLHHCQGHCRNDFDCKPGHWCQRGDPGANGCIGTPKPGTNYCVQGSINNVPADYNLRLGPCAGNCNSHTDCHTGFKCLNKGQPPLGCRGNPRSDYGYCNQPEIRTVGVDPTIKLDLCEGDCDSDLDCKKGLKCSDRSAGSLAPDRCYPGYLQDSTDYCVQATLENSGDQPSKTLGVCEGDCDSDCNCADGLYCHNRSTDADPAPPGCAGNPFKGHDYCVQTGTKMTWRQDKHLKRNFVPDHPGRRYVIKHMNNGGHLFVGGNINSSGDSHVFAGGNDINWDRKKFVFVRKPGSCNYWIKNEESDEYLFVGSPEDSDGDGYIFCDRGRNLDNKRYEFVVEDHQGKYKIKDVDRGEYLFLSGHRDDGGQGHNYLISHRNLDYSYDNDRFYFQLELA
mmetsp:Transcript_8693/g.13120  ORF Transcript_8693/g.13120 Transcript_8693/m.13120 type:complete len:783 (+) Transcript_8693:124-2472(+)